MSISQLPNLPHPHLPPPSIPATAAVTRILVLSNFSPALKTRDLQAAFAQWEAEKGGFRIKWIDDVTALVVFQDANVAKRAYLSLLLNPAPALPPPAVIRPYDGPDAQAIIHSVAARQHGHGGRASMSGAASGMTSGSMAGSINAGFNGYAPGSMGGGQQGIGNYGSGARNQAKPQQPPTGETPMGLGINSYGRHARSASTSSISASEPVHGAARNVSGGAPGQGATGGNGGGVGRIGGAHARHGSSGSSAFGRNSAMGAFSFGGNSSSQPKDTSTSALSPGESPYTLPPVSSSAAFRSQPIGGLATHHEGESPSGTPIKSLATARTFVPGSSSSNNANLGAAYIPNHEDSSTPGIEILGAVPFPEGGPGGYLASKERRGSGGGSSAANGGGGKKAGAGIDVLGGIRRESLDAKSAEKALREVSKALEGLGVGVAAAARS